MTPRFWLATAALGAAVFLAAAPSADACSCIPTGSYPATVCQAYVQAGTVFAGRVLSITPHPRLMQYHYIQFAVDEAFKNATAGTEVTILAPATSGLCGKSFTVGSAYLYYGATTCSPGIYTKLLANAANDLAILRSGQCANVPPAPTGLNAQTGRVDCDGVPTQPVVLNWNPVSDASSYVVKRYIANAQWTTIATDITATTHSISATSTATYAVSAVGTGGEGPRTNGMQGAVLVCARPTPTATAVQPSPTVRTTVRPTARPTLRPTVPPRVRPTVRPTSGAWQPNTFYAVNAVISYNSSSYRCLQAHTSQTGWEPPNTPALWSPQ